MKLANVNDKNNDSKLTSEFEERVYLTRFSSRFTKNGSKSFVWAVLFGFVFGILSLFKKIHYSDISSPNTFNLLRKKGTFPIYYIDTWSKWQDTEIPEIDKFFTDSMKQQSTCYVVLDVLM